MTVFEAVRFAGSSLTNTAAIPVPGTRRDWLLLPCSICAIAWCSLHPYANAFNAALDWSGQCLGVTSAVIAVDLMTRRRRLEKARRVDWVGLTSLVVGLTTPLYISHGPMELRPNPGWYPWLLPSYVVGFLVGFSFRLVQKIRMLR